MDAWTVVWIDGSTGRKIDVVVEIISIIIVREGTTQTGPRDEESKAVLPGRFKKNCNKETLLWTTVIVRKHSKYIQILQLLRLKGRNMLQFGACFAHLFQKLIGRSKELQGYPSQVNTIATYNVFDSCLRIH